MTSSTANGFVQPLRPPAEHVTAADVSFVKLSVAHIPNALGKVRLAFLIPECASEETVWNVAAAFVKSNGAPAILGRLEGQNAPTEDEPAALSNHAEDLQVPAKTTSLNSYSTSASLPKPVLASTAAAPAQTNWASAQGIITEPASISVFQPEGMPYAFLVTPTLPHTDIPSYPTADGLYSTPAPSALFDECRDRLKGVMARNCFAVAFLFIAVFVPWLAWTTTESVGWSTQPAFWWWFPTYVSVCYGGDNISTRFSSSLLKVESRSIY
jgi:hypothetical protein